MSHILICAYSNPGHVTPMLAAGVHLAKLDHTITFHTAEVFRRKVEKAGLRFVGTTGKADFDYRNPGNFEGQENITLTERSNYFLKQTIAEALPDLDRDLQKILKESPVDLILTSSMYFGAFPLLLRSGESRPPVIGCGVNPLMLSSVDCGPLSPPDDTPEGRQRIREANLQTQMAFAPMQEALNGVLKKCSVPALSEFWLDAIYTLPDLVLQFSGEAFEFPRSDMPPHLRFVGPIVPALADGFEEPAWWSELDGSKPVILVTQGTLANRNLDDLIQPALTALANDDVLVICGESEDKAFTAVRLGWSGAGINLKTGRPTVDQLHTAVHAVLANKSYQEQAERIQKNIAQYNSLEEMSRHIDAALTHANQHAAAKKARTQKTVTRIYHRSDKS